MKRNIAPGFIADPSSSRSERASSRSERGRPRDRVDLAAESRPRIHADALVQAFAEDLELSPDQGRAYLRIASAIDEHLAARECGGDWRAIDLEALLGEASFWGDDRPSLSQRFLQISELIELLRWMVVQGLLPGRRGEAYVRGIESWVRRYRLPEALWRNLDHLLEHFRLDCEDAS